MVKMFLTVWFWCLVTEYFKEIRTKATVDVELHRLNTNRGVVIVAKSILLCNLSSIWGSWIRSKTINSFLWNVFCSGQSDNAVLISASKILFFFSQPYQITTFFFTWLWNWCHLLVIKWSFIFVHLSIMFDLWLQKAFNKMSFFILLLYYIQRLYLFGTSEASCWISGTTADTYKQRHRCEDSRQKQTCFHHG